MPASGPICGLVAAMLVTLPLDAQTSTARRGDDVEVLHGTRVADPYRWMEDLDSEETRRWVRAQDSASRRFLAAHPDRSAIRARVSAIASVDRLSAAVRRGGRWFHSTFGATGPGAGTVLWVRDAPNAAPRAILGGDDFERRTGRVLGRWLPSDDGRLLAYTLRSSSSNWETLHVRDLASGRELADSLVGINAARSTLSWDGAGGLIYVRYDVPVAGAERQDQVLNPRLMRHRLGTPQAEDERMFDQPAAPRDLISHAVTDDGRWLVVAVRESGSRFNSVHVRDLRSSATGTVPLVARADARYALIGAHGARLLFLTDLDAPRWRVIAIDAAASARERWTEVVPEARDAIDTWGSGGTVVALGAAAIGDRLLVRYLHDAAPRVRVFDLEGRFRYDLALPAVGSMWGGFTGRQGDDEAFYVLSGVVDPGSVYRLDVRTGVSTLFDRPKLPYSPDDFVTAQVFFDGKDGTRIPMFVAHRKGTRLDGTAPAYMYGYGAAAWAAAPWFQPNMAAWLEMGGVWALPNIRGGGEYGEAWHQAGVRRNRHTAIDDYIAAAEWLSARRYTSRDRLVANTSSVGAAMVAAAVIQRPELFGASVIDYPLIDVLRFDRFTGGRSWIPEYGSATDSADFEALRRYAPLQSVREGGCHPPTLIAPGELDETTVPMHAYKLAATLQWAQRCDKPILLRVSWGAGHSSGATLAGAVETWADQLAFLRRVLPPAPSATH